MMKIPPNVWILASPHSGDNTQLLALADNLGWPFAVKTLKYQPWQGLTRLLQEPTLFGLAREQRKAIAAPFPDIIIAAGHSTESVAFWIKKRAPHWVKLVYIGTPLTKLDRFDLVITTPQYGLPRCPNVLHLDLPMHGVASEKLNAAKAKWLQKLAHLPRPWTAVLVGGASGPYTFRREAAKRLAIDAQNFQGSVLVTTSARTPRDVTQTLRAELTKPHFFHDWQDKDAENPFLGFLALADQFIVTADSISMLSEACATGKAVIMFDIEKDHFAMRDGDGGGHISLLGHSFYATVFRFAMRFGPKRWTRDLRVVHRQLISAGLANWLGEPVNASRTSSETSSLQQATSRVRSLFNL